MLIPGDLYKFSKIATEKAFRQPIVLLKPNIFSGKTINVGYDGWLLFLGETAFQYSKNPTDYDVLLTFLYNGERVYTGRSRYVLFERVEINESDIPTEC